MGKVLSLNADYNHKFSDNHTFSFTNQYSNWIGRDENTFTVDSTNENYQFEKIKSKINYTKDNLNYSFRSNIDYKRPLFTGTLETGAQYRYEKRREDMTYWNYNIVTHENTKNDIYSHLQNYVNTIYSGYITYSDTKWGIGYQFGLRGEYFLRTINITTEKEPLKYNQPMIYPSLHFSKDFNDKTQLQLSYSRRINRPQPWLLTNNPSFIDPSNIFIGNTSLKPEFTDAYEFNYRTNWKKATISVQTYFRNTTNNFITLRLEKNGVMYHQEANGNNQKSFGAELGLDLNLFKWWQINSGANIYQYTINALVDTVNISKNTNTWDGRIVNNFTLKWGTRIQAIGYYRAAGLDQQGEYTGFFTSNLAVNQPLFKGKANIGISVQNIFNSIEFDYKVKDTNVNNNYHIQAEGRMFMINFSYSFNNFKDKQRGRADDINFKGGGSF